MNSLQLKECPPSSCLTMVPHSMVRNLDNFPVTLTSFIQHQSPHFHQLNGFIESMVKKVKNAYKNMDRSPNAQAKALLQLRDTPHHGRPPVPSRDPPWTPSTRYCSFKTIQEGQYMPDLPEACWAATETERTVRQSPSSQEICVPLKVKDQVQFFQNKPATGPIKWMTGTVTEALECGWSYTIRGPNGRVYRRNRAHIKPICHDGTSFQDHRVKERGKTGQRQFLSRPFGSFQDHAGQSSVIQ